VEDCKPLGAPLVFVCSQNGLQWWKQGARAPEFLESIPADNVSKFFEEHREQFSPDAVYRAKTWGRFQSAYQLSFVDLGLMPLVEGEVGKSLDKLIEQNVSALKDRLGWGRVTDDQGRWLLQTVFWLVSGKILSDKQVAAFRDLKLDDVEDVFQRLANHYGTKPLTAGSQRKLEALQESARIISRHSSLVLTTTESLAHVYENTLIEKQTRSSLSTHSTPSFLVDYTLGNLADWIREIPADERSVFEPASGHAAFLVSAMRLLTEMLPAGMEVPSRRGPYLRSRLHGSDLDPFALELARLSLTLTDIPNPDHWDLNVHDMFVDDHLPEQAKRNTILLANPPFDNFTPKEQRHYRTQGCAVRFVNKCAEMLWRTLPHLPKGAVFGVVVPQTLLHSGNARDLRRFILQEYELKELCLFPDGMFSFSDAESAVVIGRHKAVAHRSQVRYRRVRERELESFRLDYSASFTRTVPQLRFSGDQSLSLQVPDLEEVWVACANNPTLTDIAVLGQGLAYHGQHLPRNAITYSSERFPGGQRGFVFFDHAIQLHQSPKLYWMNLDRSVIHRPRAGTTVGVPQVLLNYAPASRGPWRLKALIDRRGHPVTSRFIPVRPRAAEWSLETLWALLNSPLANGYAFSHLGKRDNTVGDIRKIPMPKERSFESVRRAAEAYLGAASSGVDSATLQKLLLIVDCEVLKLYSLPVELEQSLLAVFTDYERVGVPFSQTHYLPTELEHSLRFADFFQFEEDWPTTNRERGILIDKNISGTISTEEQLRLNALQAYADYHIDRVAPRPTGVLDELEKRLFPGLPKKDGAA
jgi:N-6 DNA Methylase